MPESLKESINATKVSYANLGSSGLRLSVPILGAMSFGSNSWMKWVESDEAAAMELLKAAYDRGLNSWDTANVYSNGTSEEIIGKALKKYSIPRHKVIILSKCFGTVGETPDVVHIRYPQMRDTRDYVNQGGLSRAAIFNAVDASLSRLQTDYIDVLQIHRYDKRTPEAETMRALHDLVQAGKVRYIGASSMWAYQFQRLQYVAEKNGWTKFVSMQNQYSLCYREEEREMNPFCAESGVGLIPWAPLYRGHLARPLDAEQTERGKTTAPLSDVDKAIIGRVEEVAKKRGWSMGTVALAWTIAKGANPIVGISSIKRLDETIEVTGKSLTEEEIKYLEEPYKPRAILGHS
ncbi:Aldo/keto reductase [Trichodelitschia bisporula]|uniref:Aldo/keto reductase n=1 Tax=Trichodelitschia bisporula TaxID=703511 RepID=A0A6G1HUK3_9PEZI|nr:Aldo/keto reductase [Trichodelitschia bisporula]